MLTTCSSAAHYEAPFSLSHDWFADDNETGFIFGKGSMAAGDMKGDK